MWLWTPTLGENNGKTTFTVLQLLNHLIYLNIDVIINRNIKNQHLGLKGLSLNDSRSKLLARKFLGKIKPFLEDKECWGITGHTLRNDQCDNLYNKNDHHKKHIKINKSFGEILIDVRQQNLNQTNIKDSYT